MTNSEALRIRRSFLHVHIAIAILFLIIAALVFLVLRPGVVKAQQFVVVDEHGQKVGHLGLSTERPGEIVLVIRKDPEHFVALLAAPDLSGWIVKSGQEEHSSFAGDRSAALPPTKSHTSSRKSETP